METTSPLRPNSYDSAFAEDSFTLSKTDKGMKHESWTEHLRNEKNLDELASTCAEALTQFYLPMEWRRAESANRYLVSFEQYAASPDSEQKRRNKRIEVEKFFKEFLRILRMGFRMNFVEKEGHGAHESRGELLMFSILEIAASARLAGKVAADIFDFKTDENNKSDESRGGNATISLYPPTPEASEDVPDSVSEKHAAATLQEAFGVRHLVYDADILEKADIVWGLAGLITQLKLDITTYVSSGEPESSNEAASRQSVELNRWKTKWENLRPFKHRKRQQKETQMQAAGSGRHHSGGSFGYDDVQDSFDSNLRNALGGVKDDRFRQSRDNSSRITMIGDLRALFLKVETTSPERDVSAELWLMKYEKVEACPNPFGALASFCEMAMFLADGVMSVLEDFTQGDHQNRRLVFPEDEIGSARQHLGAWTRFKTQQGRDTNLARYFSAMDALD